MNSSSVNRTLKAACAAAAVATSWGASQQAHAAVTVFEGLSGSTSPTTRGLTQVYLFFASSSSGYPIPQAFALPNAPAGQTTSFYVDAQLDGYNEHTIMGVYDVDKPTRRDRPRKLRLDRPTQENSLRVSQIFR